MERLLEYFTPDDYALNLTIDRKSENLTGNILIVGQPKSKTVKFHAVDMDIKSVKISNTEPQHFEDVKYNYDGQILEVLLDQKYEQLIDIEISYSTKLNRNLQGCYISTYNYNNEEQKLVATQFESHYAREAFPCIDEPAAKAIFNLELTLSDRQPQDVILANTEPVKQDENRVTFAPTPRMSTYLLAWVVGPLKSISTTNQHGVKVTSYCALNQNETTLEFANQVAARALDYYDEKFGIKYPLSKLYQVALPDFEAGAMENWGLVTYRESCMLAEPNASVDTKQSVALTVTHELSHQWFGDLVTMEWWDDLWLNESFATIMEYYATDALYPEFKAWQDFYTGSCVAALKRDCIDGVQAVQQEVHNPEEIATLFDSAIVYAKGARLILMLIQLMGEQNFYQGVHDYFEEYKYSNTVGDNLWDKLQNYANFDVKALMHAWISQPGYPMLSRSGDGSWTQQRFLIDGKTDDTKWPLPEVKDDMSGHYLIDLSDSEFTTKLTNFKQLDDQQKLRLLIDRMLLAKSRAVPSASLFDLLPKFTNEDAAVWDILLNIINDLKIFFVTDSAEDVLYRKFLRDTIHARVREVGAKPRPDETSNEKRLRNILLVTARFAKDQEIIDALATQYNPDLSQLNAELRGNILMSKLMTSEAETFPELLHKYQTENDPEIKDDILYTLASAKEPTNITTLLELLEKPEIVRPQDHYYLCAYMLRNNYTRLQTENWIYTHWDYIVKISGDKNTDYYPRCIANNVMTSEEAQKFYEFCDQHSDDPALKRTLAMAKVSIEAKLALIESESATVHAKLNQILKEE